MNEHTNDILLSVSGTVTIDTMEYRSLVERNAYLDVILAFAHDPASYILKDVACIVGDLLNGKIVCGEVVAPEAKEGVGDDA